MKRMFLGTTAMLTLAASLAFAGPIDDQIVAGLQAQGFDRIEVKTGPTQIKVEAIRGNTKVEYVYDALTGALLSQETGPVEPGDDISVGVDYENEDDDFIGESDDSGNDDLDESDESDDDSSNDSLDEENDESSSDDEGSDDNGGASDDDENDDDESDDDENDDSDESDDDEGDDD